MIRCVISSILKFLVVDILSVHLMTETGAIVFLSWEFYIYTANDNIFILNYDEEIGFVLDIFCYRLLIDSVMEVWLLEPI